MDRVEYIELKRAIQEDCQKKIEALDLVFSLSEEFGFQTTASGAETDSNSASASKSAESTNTNQTLEAAFRQIKKTFEPSTESSQKPISKLTPSRNGDSKERGDSEQPFRLKDAVKAAVEEIPDDKLFAQKTITFRIRRKYPNARVYPGSVSSALSRLVEREEIRVVKPAFGGSNPAYYAKPHKEDPKEKSGESSVSP